MQLPKASARVENTPAPSPSSSISPLRRAHVTHTWSHARTSTKAFHLRCQRAAIYQPHKHVIETRSSHERGNSRREQFARVEACAGRGVPENLVRADATKTIRKYETSTHRKCSIRTQPLARTWALEYTACSCVANALEPIPSGPDNHNHVLYGDEKLADYLQAGTVEGQTERTA